MRERSTFCDVCKRPMTREEATSSGDYCHITSAGYLCGVCGDGVKKILEELIPVREQRIKEFLDSRRPGPNQVYVSGFVDASLAGAIASQLDRPVIEDLKTGEQVNGERSG